MDNFYSHVKTISLIFLTLFISFDFAFAQNTTKQRTTGTYLPANAATVRRDTIVTQGQQTELSLPDGSLTITVPENFYTSDIRFSLARITHRNNSAVPTLKIENEDFVGNEVFEITATDQKNYLPILKFTKFITINFRYLDQEINNFDENKTIIRYFDRLDQKWVEVDTNRNLDSNTLSINTDHLTLFAITAPTTTKTSIISQNTTNNNQNTGTPFWQTLLISLIILTLLGFGAWYVYTNYLHDYLDSIKSQEQSIFGGSADTESKSTPPPQPTNVTLSNPTPKSTDNQSKTPPKTNIDKKSDDDQEIWINF